MNAVRSLALRISHAVIRWSSPGCKEWAEAQSRELAFIPNDWAALRWSVGSTRVLLDRRTAARSELPSKPTFLNVISWLLYLEACIWTCTKMLTSTGWYHRLGWGLCLLACGYWAACSVFDWLRERWQPSRSDVHAYRLFLREGLEQKLARYRTVRRWFPILAMTTGYVGYGLIVQGRTHFWAQVITVGWIALHSPETPTAIQARIARIDAEIALAQPLNLKLNGFKRVHSDHWGRPQTPKP